MKDREKSFKKNFDKILNSHKGRVIISSHINPDDDSISSSLSLYIYLKNFLKIRNEIRICYSNKYVDRWEKIKNFDHVEFVNDVSDILTKSDMLIILDCRDYHRISKFPDKIKNLNLQTVTIDHHKTISKEKHFLSLCHPEISAPSNAQIIYSMFFRNEKTLDGDLAEILLLGIYGDTGGFRFVKKEDVEVFDFAKEIIEKSRVSVDSLLSKLENYKINQLHILGEILKNITFVDDKNWGKYSYTFLDREFTRNYTKEEISLAKGLYGFYQKAIENTGWGFFVYPTVGIDSEWSFSFRSQPGKPNVRLVAEGLDKNGGGHDAAAGGRFLDLSKPLDAKKVVAKIQDFLKNNRPEFIPV